MKPTTFLLLLLAALCLSGCSGSTAYTDVSGRLPRQTLGGLSMDAAAADIDGDGDLDLLVAQEYAPNILLVNDGTGRLSDRSRELIPQHARDSEDIAIADFDADGDVDVVVVSEDDQVNEYYVNNGDGSFSDRSELLPVTGTTNAIEAFDANQDGFPDLFLGNNGQNELLLADGTGGFTVATDAWLPRVSDVTQDLEVGDVNGDGSEDVVLANEDDNRLLLRDGDAFVYAPAGGLPLPDEREESREAALGDVDGDGDLDLLLANVRAFVADADPQNRLLINDGAGRFADRSELLPDNRENSFDADFIDIDRDGDLDIVGANAERGWRAPAEFFVWENNGEGRFEDATARVLPRGTVGAGFDVEAADFDGDGIPELFLANRGGEDLLLQHRRGD